MTTSEVRSDYVAGAFLEPHGEPLVSVNPAKDGAIVVSARWSPSRVDQAVAAAKAAQPAWSRLSLDERWQHLVRFRAAIEAKKEYLADAIVQEIGKIRSEARVEIQTLIGRFDLVLGAVKNDLKDGQLPGFPNEALRWHPHGVVAVIGPFNFPLHLCHAHVIPALLLGNTVVMKPSEVAPLCGIRYAEVAHEAGLPAGVLNVLHGRAQTGSAIVQHPDVHALAFTGSWPVGRRISEAVLDRPEMLVALEMGGKNTAIVCEDADVRQAAHELIVGSYLTTGQRCTCTDRVLVHSARAKDLIDALIPLVRSLRFGDPDDASAFAGPLATEAGRTKLERAMATCEAGGADVPVEGTRLPGGFFRTASFHVLPRNVHTLPGYTDVELFGPDLGIEIVEDDDEAIAAINASPYGFANSVFTPSDGRFDRYYRETRVGILNRNRSTNQASPRLPFGGTGRSGNFRPAGSFASRNLAIPVAVQSNAPYALPVLPALRAHLPAPDLDRLEAAHAAEEACEAARNVIDTPRPEGPHKPAPKAGIRLPQSAAMVERFAAADRTVREKKLPVFDHLRSRGGWYVSIDDEPLSVLDAMSQTATMPFGFNDDALVKAYAEGAFGDTILRAHPITHGTGKHVADQYAEALRALVPGLPTVCFTACGAEANEKAYALCRLQKPEATKLLAFDGSFHGRTLLSLYASHSPSKRVPFEIAGYEVTFAPYPTWTSPDPIGPSDPEGWRELLGAGDVEGFRAKFAEHDDALIRAEAKSLLFVADALLGTPRGGAQGAGDRATAYFAVVIEPMQSEGGDRYATPRFHRGLRLLTRALHVSLIMDEVQAGFGLGGPVTDGDHGGFAWHRSFGLVDRHGESDTPDCVLFAKRAQVGVVMSRYADPEPTQAFAASLVRGRLHASLLAESNDAQRIEAIVKTELPTLSQRWSHLISNPRARGYALAFELPTPTHLAQYLAGRFSRGAIVFAAGDRTVRYRLQARMTERDLRFLFATIHQSLAWLEAHGWAHGTGTPAPEWDETPMPSVTASHGAPKCEIDPSRVVIRRAQRDEKAKILPQILALEARVYEPARRDPEARLAMGFTHEGGVGIVAFERDEHGVEHLIGSAIACPLEEVSEMQGPDRDPHRGHGDSAYTVALTIDPRASGLRLRGLGLGTRLKEALLKETREEKKADGSPRYRWMVGRNRVGLADAMSRINDRFGAFTVFRLDKQYEEGVGVARYYRQPLRGVFPAPPALETGGVGNSPTALPAGAPDGAGPPARTLVELAPSPLPGSASQPPPGGAPDASPHPTSTLDVGSSVVSPFATPPASLVEAAETGALAGPAVNKLTLVNYLTPAVVRATEHVAAIVPDLPHVFFTSGRDETFDKSLRMLRWHRKEGQIAIGLEGGYVGHTTAAARSLSDPRTHRQGPPHFAFPRVPHPALVGVSATIEALRSTIASAGGPSKVLGLYVEMIGERSGLVIEPAFLAALNALRGETKIPIVLVETASAYFKSGRGAFASSAFTRAGSLEGGGSFVPDILTWFTGGQHGYVHVSAPYFVPTPLTFVSTWDGDELSMIQAQHQLRAARKLDVASLAAILDEALIPLSHKGFTLRGQGLYRVIDAGDRAEALVAELAGRGLHTLAYPNGCVPITPALDQVEQVIAKLG
ncbi:MAG: aldehyde dehydrogenase family protein [Sandaracinaceae bacterium]|nr:aldehyde dehydrogenase family protein [Sandaracinaceae bacterium]